MSLVVFPSYGLSNGGADGLLNLVWCGGRPGFDEDVVVSRSLFLVVLRNPMHFIYKLLTKCF